VPASDSAAMAKPTRQPGNSAGSSDGSGIVRLLASLGSGVSLLLHQEVALARSEAAEKLVQIGVGLGFIAGAGILGLCGLLYLLASATAALSRVVDAWLAALMIAFVIVIAGGLLARIGSSHLKSANLTALRTRRSLRNDVALAKERLR
jgi:hypothetical protein